MPCGATRRLACCVLIGAASSQAASRAPNWLPTGTAAAARRHAPYVHGAGVVPCPQQQLGRSARGEWGPRGAPATCTCFAGKSMRMARAFQWAGSRPALVQRNPALPVPDRHHNAVVRQGPHGGLRNVFVMTRGRGLEWMAAAKTNPQRCALGRLLTWKMRARPKSAIFTQPCCTGATAESSPMTSTLLGCGRSAHSAP